MKNYLIIKMSKKEAAKKDLKHKWNTQGTKSFNKYVKEVEDIQEQDKEVEKYFNWEKYGDNQEEFQEEYPNLMYDNIEDIQDEYIDEIEENNRQFIIHLLLQVETLQEELTYKIRYIESLEEELQKVRKCEEEIIVIK